MIEPVQNFFTFESFGTLGGASVAVIVVSNTYRTLFNSDSAMPAFIASVMISFVGAYSSDSWKGVPEAFLILLNSCLLFCAALGILETGLGIKNKPMPGEIREFARSKVAWFSPWFKR